MKVDMLVSKNQPDNWFEKITYECMCEYPISLVNLQKNDYLVDVGCNVGGFSQAFKDKFNNILAIDASLYNVNEYKSRHRHEVWHKAVHSIDGQIVRLKKLINKDNDDTTSGNFSTFDSFYEHNGYGWNGEEYEEVFTVSLDTIVSVLKNIGLLKVDVEGSEWNFLYQKDLSKIKYITGEFHNFLGVEKLNNLFDWISNTHSEIYSSGNGVNCHFVKMWKLK